LEALYCLGADAKSAIPALNDLVNNPKTSRTAIIALFAIGKDGIPALTEACSHTNKEVRVLAALVLSKLKRGRIDVTFEIHPNSAYTKPVFSWGFTGDAILGITNGLYDAKPGVRRASAEALGAYAFGAKKAVPTLLEAAKDSDEAVRVAVTNALKQIDPEAAAKAGVK
jgi:HEAT repeat protein